MSWESYDMTAKEGQEEQERLIREGKYWTKDWKPSWEEHPAVAWIGPTIGAILMLAMILLLGEFLTA